LLDLERGIPLILPASYNSCLGVVRLQNSFSPDLIFIAPHDSRTINRPRTCSAIVG